MTALELREGHAIERTWQEVIRSCHGVCRGGCFLLGWAVQGWGVVARRMGHTHTCTHTCTHTHASQMLFSDAVLGEIVGRERCRTARRPCTCGELRARTHICAISLRYRLICVRALSLARSRVCVCAPQRFHAVSNAVSPAVAERCPIDIGPDRAHHARHARHRVARAHPRHRRARARGPALFASSQ